MEDIVEVHDSCNVVLVGGYEQEDVIDAVDLTAIISQDKECEPRRASKWILHGLLPTWLCIHAFVNFPSSLFFVDASSNIGMKKDEDVDVAKAIGLVADVMANALVVDLFNLALR